MTPYSAAEAKKLLLVALQQHGEDIHPVSLELAAAAIRLAQEGGMATAGVFITGELTEKSRRVLGCTGLGEVRIYQDSRYRPFIGEHHCAALVHCACLLQPEILLVGATPEGRILAPMAAIHLGSGVTADCTDLAIEKTECLLIQTRPAFGGNIMAQIITPQARPQIATVRAGVFRPSAVTGNTITGATRLIMEEPLPFRERGIHAESVEKTETEDITAKAILALGAGVRAKEDIELFRELCSLVSLELMCSRSLVERGWFPYSRQIGLSGRSVSPKLLITMGISGSVQFMAGIREAQQIIAVNSDPCAPILRIADIPIVGDLYQIGEELLKLQTNNAQCSC